MKTTQGKFARRRKRVHDETRETDSNSVVRTRERSKNEKKRQSFPLGPVDLRFLVFVWDKIRRCAFFGHLPQNRRTLSLILLVCVCFVMLLYSGRPVWGDGYNPEGGLAGTVCDSLIESLRWNNGKPQHQGMHHLELSYPYVPVRSSREEVLGYSAFLEVILNWNLRKRKTAPSVSLNRGRKPTAEPRRDEEFSVQDNPRLLHILQSTGCRPGWLCHRCLLFRSYDAHQCQTVCPGCFVNILCSNVQNSRYLCQNMGEPQTATSSSIPRIIHQVGRVEWLDANVFPNLVRLTNSWRQQSNATYRYYTPEMTFRFVRQHFSPLEKAFTSMTESERRTLFSWLILYHSGGISADGTFPTVRM